MKHKSDRRASADNRERLRKQALRAIPAQPFAERREDYQLPGAIEVQLLRNCGNSSHELASSMRLTSFDGLRRRMQRRDFFHPPSRMLTSNASHPSPASIHSREFSYWRKSARTVFVRLILNRYMSPRFSASHMFSSPP